LNLTTRKELLETLLLRISNAYFPKNIIPF